MDSEKLNKKVEEKAKEALRAERENAKIDFVIYEACNARWQKLTGCLIAAIIVIVISAFIALYVKDAQWQELLAGYDISDYEVSAEGEANANYIGGDVGGSINNGGKNKSEETDAQERSAGEDNPGEGQNN